eukprot:5201467-Pyramimonas_sp.AAC.1
MRYREDKWSSWWTPSAQQLSCLNAGMSELRSRALVALEDTPLLEVSDVARACTCFRATTALGVDLWSPRALLDAPVDSLE